MENMIRYRHNVLDVNSISGFSAVRGSLNHGLRDVYFIRALGADSGLIDEIFRMDEMMTEEMQKGRQFYKRMGKLPRLSDRQTSDFYSGCYDSWVKQPQQGIRTKESGAGTQLAYQLGAACEETLQRYCQGRACVTESIKKNFAVKLLYWFDFAFDGIGGQWNETISFKVAADNIEKEQEYLFYYLLTLTGCDVLLLQSRKDAAVDEKNRKLSKEIRIGAFHDAEIPAFSKRNAKADTGSCAGRGMQQEGSNEQKPQAYADKIVVKIPKRSKKQPSVQSEVPQREKSFEELAQLASSIVLIAVHDRSGEIISTGSGIMVGEAGYILTNNHVAGGGCFYSVRIEDDEQVYRTDELIKYHPVLDLAVMRIQRKLAPLPIYKGAKKLVRGQAVAAIGSPLGLFNSVSNGIISGFRKVDGVSMIQFTAPISHGSSGGAVLNMYGEVIGISTAGFDRGQNINLAVGYEDINLFIRGFV